MKKNGIQLLPALKGPLLPHNLTFQETETSNLVTKLNPPKKITFKKPQHPHRNCVPNCVEWPPKPLQLLGRRTWLSVARYAAFVFRSGPPMSTRRTGDCLQCFWTSPSSGFSKARRNNDVYFMETITSVWKMEQHRMVPNLWCKCYKITNHKNGWTLLAGVSCFLFVLKTNISPNQTNIILAPGIAIYFSAQFL